MGFSGKNWFICIAIPDIVVMGFGMKPVVSPTYRKWPQLLIDTKNCIYQRLENLVIPAIYRHGIKSLNEFDTL